MLGHTLLFCKENPKGFGFKIWKIPCIFIQRSLAIKCDYSPKIDMTIQMCNSNGVEKLMIEGPGT